jgi:hypothetical protein
MNFSDIVMTDRYEYLVIVTDFIISVLILTAVGKVTGLVSNVKSIHELSEKDNFSWYMK